MYHSVFGLLLVRGAEVTPAVAIESPTLGYGFWLLGSGIACLEHRAWVVLLVSAAPVGTLLATLLAILGRRYSRFVPPPQKQRPS